MNLINNYLNIYIVLGEPRDTFRGGYDACFADPDGHPWEIAWAPFWEFDEQGSLKLG